VVHTIPLGSRPLGNLAGSAGFSRQHIAAAEDAVWAINPDLSVSRIDPRTNRIVARIDDVKAENIAVGEGEVWLTEGDRLVEIDPSVNKVARRGRLGADSLSGLAIGAGAVWAVDPLAGNLWRVDSGSNPTKRAIPLETWVAGVSFGEGAVWVTNEIGDVVYRFDPHTGTPKQVGEATSPRAVDAGDGALWPTAASPPSKDAALPASVCQGVHYDREGSPDVLIVSSLPVEGRPAMDTTDGRRDTACGGATWVRSRPVLGRLPLLQLVDRAGRRRGVLPMRLHREGVHSQPARGRRLRLLHVALLVPADPHRERSGRFR